MKDLLERLNEAGGVGLDMSPGNPLAAEAYLEISRLRASKAELLAATKKVCIMAEYDYPGDFPELCGFSCLVCRGHGPTETTIEHTPQCAITGAEKEP